MLTLGHGARIFVAVQPVDGRKSYDTLAAVVTATLDRDPLSGDLFVFANKRRNRLAILLWQTDGYVLIRKRLEQGTFAIPHADATDMPLTATQLAMLLDGIDLAQTRPRKRYKRPGK